MVMLVMRIRIMRMPNGRMDILDAVRRQLNKFDDEVRHLARPDETTRRRTDPRTEPLTAAGAS